MPELRGDDGVEEGGGGGGTGCGGAEGVEFAATIATKNLGHRMKILDRKTEKVKFDSATVISGEFVNGYKVLNKVGNNQNIVKMEGRAGGMTDMIDLHDGSIANNHPRRGGKGFRVGECTRVGRHVVAST